MPSPAQTTVAVLSGAALQWVFFEGIYQPGEVRFKGMVFFGYNFGMLFKAIGNNNPLRQWLNDPSKQALATSECEAYAKPRLLYYW